MLIIAILMAQTAVCLTLKYLPSDIVGAGGLAVEMRVGDQRIGTLEVDIFQELFKVTTCIFKCRRSRACKSCNIDHCSMEC